MVFFSCWLGCFCSSLLYYFTMPIHCHVSPWNTAEIKTNNEQSLHRNKKNREIKVYNNILEQQNVRIISVPISEYKFLFGWWLLDYTQRTNNLEYFVQKCNSHKTTTATDSLFIKKIIYNLFSSDRHISIWITNFGITIFFHNLVTKLFQFL